MQISDFLPNGNQPLPGGCKDLCIPNVCRYLKQSSSFGPPAFPRTAETARMEIPYQAPSIPEFCVAFAHVLQPTSHLEWIRDGLKAFIDTNHRLICEIGGAKDVIRLLKRYFDTGKQTGDRLSSSPSHRSRTPAQEFSSCVLLPSSIG